MQRWNRLSGEILNSSVLEVKGRPFFQDAIIRVGPFPTKLDSSLILVVVGITGPVRELESLKQCFLNLWTCGSGDKVYLIVVSLLVEETFTAGGFRDNTRCGNFHVFLFAHNNHT